jgi:hypothetical protein
MIIVRKRFGLLFFLSLLLPILFFFSGYLAGHSYDKDSKGDKAFIQLNGSYFGQKAPENKADVFLDGIISTLEEAEMNTAFTRDGKEFYYCALHRGKWSIFCCREVNGQWTKPQSMPFTSGYTDRDFTMSPDGNKIYFGSNRPASIGGKPQDKLDIFVTVRQLSGRWSPPTRVGPPVSTKEYGENYPCVAANGNLYFFSCRSEGMGGCELYMSRFVKGQYTPSVNLGSALNSNKNDWDAYIAPDESYIIFSSQDRADTVGGQDLYIAFKKKNGGWTQSKNMGHSVNSEACEICPVSPWTASISFLPVVDEVKPIYFG